MSDKSILENSSKYLSKYQEWLYKYFSELNTSSLPLNKSAQETDYENPSTAIELNNFAVINIIEAEETEDISLREFYLDLALEALETALNLEEVHPLCIAHLGILNNLLGKNNPTHNIEYSNLLAFLPTIFLQQNNLPAGLVYLPISLRNQTKNKSNLEKIISFDNGYLQAFYLLIADLEQSQMVFYNPWGLRLLHISNQIIPNSVDIKLNLGISSIFNQQLEGLLYLYQALQLQPNNSRIIQALYLSYLSFNNQQLANNYYQHAHNYYQENSDNLNWKWASLPFNNPWTYLCFDYDLLIAVEASFKSIVTAVLLAQEDWFEKEMELWRDEIKPDMIVIDVGANVGVYTFTAAKRVGKNGKVIAVEPFSGCVECLEETRKFNNFDWVEICAGAAGDENKTVKLSIHQASELNEIIKDDSAIQGDYQEVECFTLDSLVEKYNLSTVNWLKLDAEGHEIEVLMGANQILSDFKPNILYENIAGSQGNNTPVAQYLLTIGYELFYYQPFVKQFIKLDSLEELSGKLNIVALPNQNLSDISIKAQANDFIGRFREIMSDPSNKYIPRCENAGKLENGYIIMHNGLKVFPTYYGNFSNILRFNKGVHEPQEERMFMEVLKHIKSGGTMIELGSYWSFYSMWFQQQVSDGKNYMIEPDENNIRCGMDNFKLNNMTGNFYRGMIGEGGLNLSDFMKNNNIDYIDLLHLDIQGAELHFLKSTESIFGEKKVAYIFISTHSQSLHLDCLNFLQEHDYLILASADFDNQTFCYDGVIVARDRQIEGLNPIKLDVRRSDSI